MLNKFLELFTKEDEPNLSQDENKSHKLQMAACALLLEIANADDNFSSDEKLRIVKIMQSKFQLDEDEVVSLIEQSNEEIENSVSIYEFTNIINKNLNHDEKFLIVKSLWELAYVDGELDKYEDYYIKKISNNLHLHHKERVAAKMEVKEELNRNPD